MKNIKGLLLSVFLLLAVQSILSASMIPLSDNDLFQISDEVVVGRVEKAVSYWDAEHKNIYTDVTIFVEYQLKGASLGRYKTLTVTGGKVGDIIQEVTDMPCFSPGERALLFLRDDAEIVGGIQGKMALSGNRIIGRNMTVDEFAAQTANADVHQIRTFPAGQTTYLSPFEYEECLLPATTPIKMSDETQNAANSGAKITTASSIFNEGFENGFPTGQWTLSSGTNGYTWGTEGYNPYTGNYSAWCAGMSTKGQPDLNPAVDNYANSMNAWMRWGPFDLSNAVSAEMTFYLWLESESGYDYFRWGSSIDGNAFAMNKTSGLTSGWMQLTLDLSSRLGQSQVWIAFNFTSSVSNTFKGAFVDEIVISKTLPGSSSPVIYNITPGKAPAGTNAQVTITGNNFGATRGNGYVEFFYRSDQPKIKAAVISWSNTTIVCTVPVATVNGYPASASSGPVTVTTHEGRTSLGYDFIVSFGYGQRKWNTNNVPFFVNENLASISGEAAAIRNAADTWTYVGTANFSLTFAGYCTATSASYNSKNEIVWANLGTTGTVAQAICWFNTNGIILENDIVFNNSYSWGIGQGNFYDIETIALHEFGHWLNLRDLYGNLGDNVNDNTKVMYGFATTNQTKRSLHNDDREGLLHIYNTAPVFDDSWDTHELDIAQVQAQIRALAGTTQGAAAVYEEISPLVTHQRSLRRWWAMHALNHSQIRLYFTPLMLIEAGFSGNPVIYHYDGESWRAIATGVPQVEGSYLYVESIEPVTSWSPFALFDMGPIDVQLSSFIAQPAGRSVEISWTAAHEINAAGYELQRRYGQHTEWHTIASFASHPELTAGNDAVGSRVYRFIDATAPVGCRVLYRLRSVKLDGTAGPWMETVLQTAVAEKEPIPEEFSVRSAFPNPFNSATTLTFTLPKTNRVQIRVYNSVGRIVAELFDGMLSTGEHSFVWNAGENPSGVYFLNIRAEDQFHMQKILLIK